MDEYIKLNDLTDDEKILICMIREYGTEHVNRLLEVQEQLSFCFPVGCDTD